MSSALLDFVGCRWSIAGARRCRWRLALSQLQSVEAHAERTLHLVEVTFSALFVLQNTILLSATNTP